MTLNIAEITESVASVGSVEIDGAKDLIRLVVVEGPSGGLWFDGEFYAEGEEYSALCSILGAGDVRESGRGWFRAVWK